MKTEAMRGEDIHQDSMFSNLFPEPRVPKDHPPGPLRQKVNRALRELSQDFQAIYSSEERPSITPEKLPQSLLLRVLYTIRSERLLMEQPDYHLLFRWFVCLSMDDKVWDHFVFSKNRGRILHSDLAAPAFGRIHQQAAQNCKGGSSAIDGQTTGYPGYAVSQRLRKRVEEIFGWINTAGNLSKTRYRGLERVGWMFTLTAAADNLVRIHNVKAAVSP